MSWFAPNLAKEKHCFFDRKGGVSQGRYAELNVNRKSLDKPENIIKNLNLAATHLGLTSKNLAMPCQGVSNYAVYVDKPSLFEQEADAFVTNRKDILLGITTADCAPVLFADKQQGIIGAAHAGWRGAVKGIMENTLNLMMEYGAKLENIAAAIGPCLQKKSFAAKEDMRQEFLRQDEENKRFFEQVDAESYLFDMEQYLIFRLRKFGISNISASGIDTYTSADYFSYRRECHKNTITQKADFPIQLSTIRL